MASWGLAPLATVLIDLVIMTVPLLVAVIAAGVIAGGGEPRGPERVHDWVRAVGLRAWRGSDLLLGIAVALIARALVELIAPTSGSLGGGFAPTAPVVIAAVAAVVVSPVVEELFFRGLVQRALADGLGRAGRVAASAVAIAVSTGAFVLLHVLAGGAGLGVIAATLAVGIGCGVLTAVTGRLGGAIVAHVLFNAAGIALLIW
ncbi:hypothetical protein Microterr_04510 [Microbacterium terricola]|uniref:CAAX prenyl protease 2/Lysostaphin resistance protein A-like domain-containing protein n=2 Tax=Microbacterium terricola TaxID=344163 RepID=A0ABM8DVZ3_9MICO|nr:hypothetical protein Microterr_04510 [Microbacterium terricola]